MKDKKRAVFFFFCPRSPPASSLSPSTNYLLLFFLFLRLSSLSCGAPLGPRPTLEGEEEHRVAGRRVFCVKEDMEEKGRGETNMKAINGGRKMGGWVSGWVERGRKEEEVLLICKWGGIVLRSSVVAGCLSGSPPRIWNGHLLQLCTSTTVLSHPACSTT